MFGSQHLKVEYGLLIRLKLILLITELKNLTYIKRKDSREACTAYARGTSARILLHNHPQCKHLKKSEK